MKPNLRTSFLLVLLLILPLFQSVYAAGMNTVLKGLDGEDMRLSDYVGKGKWVLFNIWGPKCPPCLEEVSELVSFHEDHKDDKAVVVSIALDFPSFGYAKADEVRQFVDDYFVTFPVMLGDAELSRQVTGEPLLGTPTTYLYDPEGKLAAVRVGTVTQEMIEKYISRYKKKG